MRALCGLDGPGGAVGEGLVEVSLRQPGEVADPLHRHVRVSVGAEHVEPGRDECGASPLPPGRLSAARTTTGENGGTLGEGVPPFSRAAIVSLVR